MTLQRRISAGISMPALTWFAATWGLCLGLKTSIIAPAPAPAPGPMSAAEVDSPFNYVAGGPAATAKPQVHTTPPPPPPYPPSEYDGNGLDWNFGMCFSRERQSPINFDDHLKDPPSDMLRYNYQLLRNVRLPMHATKGLHYVDTSNVSIGGAVFNGDIYPLVRIDFHSGAEHLFKGKRLPLEIQLVHRKLSDPTKNLIIAIPVWSEKTPMPPLIPILDFINEPLHMYFPPQPTEVDFNIPLQTFLTVRPPAVEGDASDIIIPMMKPLDVGAFIQNIALPGSGHYIQYSGSLTTPPCSDMTTWFVKREPILASNAQTQAFATSAWKLTNTHGNFRGVMPVNQRALRVYRAQFVPNLAMHMGTKRLPLGPNARTDKEFQAEKLADMADELSQDAVDYMGDFRKRLLTSARRLSGNLRKIASITTPPPPNRTLDEWDKAVMTMQGAMQNIVNGVQNKVDESMREQTMRVHKKAAAEAERARRMTLQWQAAAPPTAR